MKVSARHPETTYRPSVARNGRAIRMPSTHRSSRTWADHAARA